MAETKTEDTPVKPPQIVWTPKNIIGESLIVPGQYIMMEISGPNPENYVCDAPTDKNLLKELVEDIESGKQDLVKSFVTDPSSLSKEVLSAAKVLREKEKAAKVAAIEEAKKKDEDGKTKIKGALVKLESLRTMSVSRNATQTNEFLDLIYDALLKLLKDSGIAAK